MVRIKSKVLLERKRRKQELKNASLKKKTISEKKLLAKRERRKKIDLRRIRKQQKSKKLAIPALAFQRFVRHYCSKETRISPEAINTLQEAFEAYFIRRFRLANLFTMAAKRITVRNIDIVRAEEARKV